MEEQSDIAIWNKVKRKDKTAFKELYNRYADILIVYGNTITTNNNTIKDVLQELFMDIWGNAVNRSTPKYIKAYLMTSFRNNLLRQIKKEQKIVSLEIDTSTEDISLSKLLSDLTTDNRIKTLQVAISKLPQRQKEMINLKFYQGMKNREIADIMNINSQSTANLLQRSINKLKSIIADI